MSEFPTLQNIISMVKYEVGESHGFKWYYLKDWECCIVKKYLIESQCEAMGLGSVDTP